MTNIIPNNVIDASNRFAPFKAIPGVQFDWRWAAAHAPSLRIAALVLQRNDCELERMLRAVDDAGELEPLMDLLMHRSRERRGEHLVERRDVRLSLERMGHG
jgi:hypothetical protein